MKQCQVKYKQKYCILPDKSHYHEITVRSQQIHNYFKHAVFSLEEFPNVINFIPLSKWKEPVLSACVIKKNICLFTRSHL